MEHGLWWARVWGVFLALALLTVGAGEAQFRVQEIIATADGTVRNGTQVILDTEFLNAERALTFEDRSISEFSLATFPQGNQLLSARLRLYSLTTTTVGVGFFSLSAYEGDGVVTVEDYDRINDIIGTLLVEPETFSFTELDVTLRVRDFLADGAEFAGFLLWPRADGLRFAYASNDARRFLAAKLVITSVDFGSDCFSTGQSLCLEGGRFNVMATSRQRRGPTLVSRVEQLSDNTGYFNFGNPSNVELVAKVLNGCNTFGSYFFFAAGLTNLEINVYVADLQANQVQGYVSPLGTAYRPVQDTATFRTCP